MDTVFCSLDKAGKNVVAVFSCAQDISTWPYQTEISIDDARYVAFYAALSALARVGMLAPPDTPTA